ncbi:MAG: hypothetical protein E3J90_09755 [Promethearchaeota archaeon]|nr:MAG: hypothetical protein E3J90_09755 [Candidatus Lokiarchaeota archaeon]
MSVLNVKAHSPITMDMEYDLNAQELSVKITHGVTDPEYHYVYLIEVWVNSSDPYHPPEAPDYSFPFTEQPAHNLNNYKLSFPAGDIANITVTAHCSLGGSLTEHFYVGQPYYNPHGTFALAVIPTIVSTIIVFSLLFFLPYLGQKNAPKIIEGKSRY